jgi:hypothetical protein
MELSAAEVKTLKEIADCLLDWGGFWDQYGEFGSGGTLSLEEEALLKKVMEETL